MFTVTYPQGAVYDWLLPWMFEVRLGLNIDFQPADTREIRLDHNGHALIFPAQADLKMAEWAMPNAARITASRLLKTLDKPLPVLSEVDPAIWTDKTVTRFNFDPCTMIAALLSGAQDILDPTRDEHARYNSKHSLPVQEGWLNRPIVDETIAVLRGQINQLWPNTADPVGAGTMQVSCDIDQPFSPDLRHPLSYLRSIAGDLKNRKDIWLAARRALNGVLAPLGVTFFDTSNTFDRYLRLLETNGMRGQFFVISGHSGGAIDGFYHLHEKRIQTLLSQIAARGHFLGTHGSYNTFQDEAQFAAERENLISTLANVQIDLSQHGTGNRQHYLRWDASCTPDHLEAVGFEFDTSGSYPDAAGFRYGTSHAFPMWSWQKNAALSIQQHPLIAMECSVIAPRYMGLGYSADAYAVFENLQDEAMRHGGTFTLLWHNSHFTSEKDWALFEHLIKRGAAYRASKPETLAL